MTAPTLTLHPNTLRLLGFVLCAVITVAAAYIDDEVANASLHTLSGAILGWLGLGRPGDVNVRKVLEDTSEDTTAR